MERMSAHRPIAGSILCLLFAFGGTATAAGSPKREKDKPAATAAAKKPECARANYPGDPVCGWDDSDNLPTPSARAVRREVADDVIVNDKMSVGSADPVAMGKPPATAGNPYPVRKKEPVGGGAAVNYKF